MPRSFCILVGLAILALAPVARADDRSDLDKVRAAYQAGNYGDAETKLRAMLDPTNGTMKDPTLTKQARMYYAAVMIARRKNAEASAAFEKLLIEDTKFEPDPLSFPSEVLDAFFDTRGKLTERLNAEEDAHARRDRERRAHEEEQKKKQGEYVHALEALAREDHVAVKHSRIVASLPFGAGQFQNGQKALGWTFLAAESAFLVANLVAIPFWFVNRQRAFNAYTDYDLSGSQSYLDRANAAQIANEAFFGAFVGTAVLGILHAQLTFVPESLEIRTKPLPSFGALHPFVAPSPGGATVGFGARF